MLTREENLERLWGPGMPVCYLKKGVPFWVKQQRKIVDQIKFKNGFTLFDLLMLEAPLKVSGKVRGLDIQSGCRICLTMLWFMNNQLPIPDEIEKHHHEENWPPSEIPVLEEPEDNRTVH
jgi:hypothetical protein